MVEARAIGEVELIVVVITAIRVVVVRAAGETRAVGHVKLVGFSAVARFSTTVVAITAISFGGKEGHPFWVKRRLD